MAAYAALLSLSQTTHPNRTRHKSLFSSDAEQKFRSIYEYVIHLLLFFEECPEKSNRWESRIRDVAFKIEDIIEDLVWQRIHSWDTVLNPSRVKLEYQLEDLKQGIGLIAGEVMEVRPDNPPASSSSSSSRLASTGNDAVIGLDDDVMKILSRLCGEPPILQVIPIVGMGGIGKTTLARTVYNHESISTYFDFHAWITVSQDYNLHSFRKILLGLLESMNLLEELVCRKKNDGSEVDVEEREDLYKKLEKIDVSEMKTKVFQSLKYRRYLIVMDDVWSREVWDDLIRIFPDDEKGSRIMLTTRLLDLAAYPDSNSSLHEMQIMDGAQSWNLLTQNVFCPHDLEDVGRKIAERCAGLPLAVVLVAGLLSAVNNSSRAYWEEIAKSVNIVVGRELSEILSLNYTHLPHHLRPCFLYLGGFPEDENIHAATLVRLWVAEGFLNHQNECDKSLEEVAEEYLEDLVKRNLVFVNSRKSNGKIKSCSLHDMVRDLCIRKGREEKFLRVIDKLFDPQEIIDERRISLRLSDINSLLDPTIRTILSFNLEYFATLIHLLGRFRFLRVLHDASDNHKVHSSQVFELFHLRYLALNGSLKITSAISNLVDLETLIIRDPTFRRLRQKRKWSDYDKYASRFLLPLEIWRMQQLRHLIFYDLYSLPHPPNGSKSNLPLINLQTLSLIENLVWSEKVVQMIPNVRRLGLVYTTSQDCHLHHLKDLLQLEKLKVVMSSRFSWRICQNPTFPNTLKKLTLVGGRFGWAEMSIIGSLPNLQVLKLRDHGCGEIWETADEEFPQLRFLLIEASCLRHWIMKGSCFPTLERLVLRSCQDLRKIPEDIGEIPTLELIEVEDCKKSVFDSAKEIKEYQESCGDDGLQLRCIEKPTPKWSLRGLDFYSSFLICSFPGSESIMAAGCPTPKRELAVTSATDDHI